MLNKFTIFQIILLRPCLFRAAPKRTDEEMMTREKEGRREREEMEAMSKRKKTRGDK